MIAKIVNFVDFKTQSWQQRSDLSPYNEVFERKDALNKCYENQMKNNTKMSGDKRVFTTKAQNGKGFQV